MALSCQHSDDPLPEHTATVIATANGWLVYQLNLLCGQLELSQRQRNVVILKLYVFHSVIL